MPGMKRTGALAAIALTLIASCSRSDDLARRAQDAYVERVIAPQVRERAARVDTAALMRGYAKMIGAAFTGRPPGVVAERLSPQYLGSYARGSHTVHVNTHHRFVFGGSRLEGMATRALFGADNTYDFDLTVDHEVAHAYVDEMSRSLGGRPFGGRWHSGPFIVSEGIAQYLALKARGQRCGSVTEGDMTRLLDDCAVEDRIPDWLVYAGGCHLVEPVLDTYGYEGLREILLDPPPAARPLLGRYGDTLLASLGRMRPRKR